MSSRNLSSRGGAGADVLDEYLIFLQRGHLHVERTIGLVTDMMIYNRINSNSYAKRNESSNGGTTLTLFDEAMVG